MDRTPFSEKAIERACKEKPAVEHAQPEDAPFTVKQFAARIGVHENTVRNKIKEGLILAFQDKKKGRIFIPAAEIVKYC